MPALPSVGTIEFSFAHVKLPPDQTVMFAMNGPPVGPPLRGASCGPAASADAARARVAMVYFCDIMLACFEYWKRGGERFEAKLLGVHAPYHHCMKLKIEYENQFKVGFRLAADRHGNKKKAVLEIIILQDP